MQQDLCVARQNSRRLYCAVPLARDIQRRSLKTQLTICVIFAPHRQNIGSCLYENIRKVLQSKCLETKLISTHERPDNRESADLYCGARHNAGRIRSLIEHLIFMR
jgi:hypothetical protein